MTAAGALDKAEAHDASAPSLSHLASTPRPISGQMSSGQLSSGHVSPGPPASSKELLRTQALPQDMAQDAKGGPKGGAIRTGPGDVDWDRLDKAKFFGTGTGLFTGITLALYPLSTIKTRLQISQSQGPPGVSVASVLPNGPLQGGQPAGGPVASGTVGGAGAVGRVSSPTMWSVARSIAQAEGVPGFYRGLTTVVAGMLPVRMLYMGTLELAKKGTASTVAACGGPHALGLSDAAAAGLVSAVGGMCASLSSQAVTVPVDVISSRLMAQAALPASSPVQRYKGGWDALRSILRTEGVGGLYRGLGVSLLTYAPSSFTWWGTYGASQRIAWDLYYARLSAENSTVPPASGQEITTAELPSLPHDPPLGTQVAVQGVGGMLAGVCAALVTTPLDTVKTRIQVQRGDARDVLISTKGGAAGGATQGQASSNNPVRVGAVVKQLLAEGGVGAFYKGLVPRCISMAVWGTCMVSAYEFLKRWSRID